ncbi:MAG TPA: helix-turn-helix domain-containing protein, partial [Actinomycetota bacterium]
MSAQPDHARREMARSLRRAGYSRAQIARRMGLKSSGGALGRWLTGVPPPAWTRRPRAKDHLRQEAVRLRRTGASYREISDELGVSKSTLSAWLHDVPLTEEHRETLALRQRSAVQRRADALRAASRARHRSLVRESEARVGGLSERELFVAGVVAYWAEGAKTKPWGARSLVRFSNSDAGMIRLFLAWLDLV